MYIPTIVLAECFHLVKHGKIALNFDELLARIEESDNFIVMSFDFGIVKLLPVINAPELHDRIIVATARLLGRHIDYKGQGDCGVRGCPCCVVIGGVR